jgi:aminoglycoside phosphotransferase (APT) family kinase protein
MTDALPLAATVDPAHRLDIAALAAYLDHHLDGFAGPLEYSRFSGGQSNPTYLLTTPSHRYVLRRKPAGQLLPSAHAIDREYRVLSVLRDTAMPVPEVLCYCNDASVIGSEFYVMACVDGHVNWESRLPDATPAQRSAMFDELNRVMAALHRLDVSALGLDDYGAKGNYFVRQIKRWTHQYRASETQRIESMERLIEWLPAHVPASERVSVVHGDFRIDNVIFDPVEPRIVAVLDWELSTLGDPLADFSYLCLAWHLPADGFRGLGPIDDAQLQALGIPLERDFVERYCERAGVPAVSEAEWNFYLAYNLFRGVGILQGIMKRAIDGNASSRHAREAGGRAAQLADVAWRCAERAMAA